MDARVKPGHDEFGFCPQRGSTRTFAISRRDAPEVCK
jgi:hypothetical protein